MSGVVLATKVVTLTNFLNGSESRSWVVTETVFFFQARVEVYFHLLQLP